MDIIHVESRPHWIKEEVHVFDVVVRVMIHLAPAKTPMVKCQDCPFIEPWEDAPPRWGRAVQSLRVLNGGPLAINEVRCVQCITEAAEIRAPVGVATSVTVPLFFKIKAVPVKCDDGSA